MRRGILILKADEQHPNDPSLFEIIDINSSVQNLMGKKNQNLVGHKIAEVISLKKADLEILANVMNTGQSQQFEYYVKRLDEWLLISIHLSRNNFLTVVYENITEKKMMEQKIIDSEETMRLTLEVTGEGIWEWKADNTVKHNRKWCQIIGLNEEYITHHVDDYVARIHPEDREIVVEKLNDAIKNQELFHHTYRMVRTDGKAIWVEDRGVAVVNSDGEFVRMIGSLNEITDIVETQLKLNLEKELLRSTLLSVGDGIIATDVEGNVTIINPVAENISGWNYTEVKGKNIVDFFQMLDPETDQTLYFFDTSASLNTRHERVQNKQAIFITRYGEEYVVDCSISPIHFSDQKLKGFVITFRDITELAAYQKEIEYISFHDDLTSLYNRRFMRAELRRLDKSDYFPLSIMVIDINNLKQTNDYHGHLMGDRLIKKTAHILESTFTKTQHISRIGGDEFLIFLPRTSEEEAEYLKEKLFDKVKTQQLGEIPVSMAIGHATKTKDSEDVEEILKLADNNMYKHKRIIKGN